MCPRSALLSVMRILIPLIASLMFSGCSKDRTDADPCAQAIKNAERLIKDDDAARLRYGHQPLTRERCRTAKAEELSCIGYASSWGEAETCSTTLLRVGTR